MGLMGCESREGLPKRWKREGRMTTELLPNLKAVSLVMIESPQLEHQSIPCAIFCTDKPEIQRRSARQTLLPKAVGQEVKSLDVCIEMQLSTLCKGMDSQSMVLTSRLI